MSLFRGLEWRVEELLLAFAAKEGADRAVRSPIEVTRHP
jgi:hypothetical protein